MINLNNDVLNKDRRKLFPKINTITNKFSLNTKIFLKLQNPFKFYRTFYYKYIQKDQKKHERLKKSKSVTFLSLLSKSQNHFYSVPIYYDSNCEKNISKSNRNLELNKFLFDSEIKKEKEEEDLLDEKNETNYLNFFKYKELKNLHKILMEENKLNAIKKNNNKITRNRRSKSSINIYMESLDNNLAQNKFNTRINNFFNNNISNYKTSKKQQTIKSQYEINDKLKIEGYKSNKTKYDIKKKETKFSVDFIKNNNKNFMYGSRNKNNEKKFLTSIDNTYRVKVFWNNLRRPIIITSSNSVLIK